MRKVNLRMNEQYKYDVIKKLVDTILISMTSFLPSIQNLKYKFDQFYKVSTYENSLERLEELISEFSSCGVPHLSISPTL